MNSVFHNYAFLGTSYPREQIEQAAQAVRYELTADERAAANEALLTRLHTAKEAFGPFEQHRELLRDPTIRDLAYTLAEINRPWIDTCIARERKRHGYWDSNEELVSQAVVGQGGEDAEVRGVLGAVLQFDLDRYGLPAFSAYLGRAVHNALMPTAKQERAAGMVSLNTEDGETREWRDRHQRRPERIVIDQELLRVINEAVQELPERNRSAAEFILRYVEETGERPSARELGESRVPPVSKQAGEVLMKQTMDMLADKIEELHPGLEPAGWDAFAQVFGKRRPTLAPV